MACPPISWKCSHCTEREPRSECSAGKSEQEAFGGGLAEEPGPADPEGGSHGVLLLASEAAQKKQCSDVAAGDQQHQRGGAEQREEDALAVAIVLGGERLDVGREAGEVAISLSLPLGEEGELGLRLLGCEAGGQAADDIPLRALEFLGIGSRAEGRPDVHERVDVIVRLLGGDGAGRKRTPGGITPTISNGASWRLIADAFDQGCRDCRRSCAARVHSR